MLVEKVEMADTYGIDSQKLMFHPGRVQQWLDSRGEWEKAKCVYPVYMEVSPTGACNHRCVFCGLDYMGYRPDILSLDVMRERLAEMGTLGVKSIMFAGEGEPLLHKHINELNDIAVDSGIDTAYTTNGVLLRGRFLEETLSRVTWIKVSCNAGTSGTYAAIHRADPRDFNTVMDNLKRAVEFRTAGHWPVTLGVQTLLLPENASEVETLAKIARDEVGVDYLVVKPYSQHLLSTTRKYHGIDYLEFLDMEERLTALNNDRFHVVFRVRAMRRSGLEKDYVRCLSTPFFWAYIQADGSVFTCSAFLGDQRFRIGNITECSFQELWEGPLRQRNFEFMAEDIDLSRCRINCRMDACNQYLWELANPESHINFI